MLVKQQIGTIAKKKRLLTIMDTYDLQPIALINEYNALTHEKKSTCFQK